MPNEDRPDVQIGDVVDVPAGADDVCTTRHRVEVAEIGSYGVTGPRVKADGARMISNAVESTDGFVTRTVPWSVVTKSTVLRDGIAIAGAENLTPLRLTRPQLELLTDITTKPEMFLRVWSRWSKTGTCLVELGLAKMSSEGHSHYRIIATETGYQEAARQGITVSRSDASA